MAVFVGYLTLRARALLNILRAAYPGEPIRFSRIWGAYIAAYGFNNVVPARGGDVIKLFLVKTSVPDSTYPAVFAAICVEAVFDLTIAIPVLLFAFTQGVFPKPPDFAQLEAFDLSFFAGNPQLTLFLVTGLAVAALALFAFLSRRVSAFWSDVRRGLSVLTDRQLYFREVWLVQFAGWLLRCTAFWFLLEAFGVGGSVRNVLLVLGVNAVAAIVPFTPGGAGVQQALLVKVFAGTRRPRPSPHIRSASRSRSRPSRSPSASRRSSSSSASAHSATSCARAARIARRSGSARTPAVAALRGSS